MKIDKKNGKVKEFDQRSGHAVMTFFTLRRTKFEIVLV